MKSPDPVDMSQTATWTINSPTVTLTTAVNAAVFNCDSNWTLDSAVSVATVTGKEGTSAAGVTLATAFTGLACHHNIGSTLDLSTYQQISLWINPVSINLASGVLRVDLCSDTAGTVPVASLTVNVKLSQNTWNPITLNNGSALPSNVQSIAITVLVAQASGSNKTINFDNIVACKDPSSASCLTLNSLIGQNDGIWYGLKSISGTTLKLDSAVGDTTATTAVGFAGPTVGSVEIWARQPITTIDASTTMITVAGSTSGTSGSPITISGGWDTTAMTSQTGDTFFDQGGNTTAVTSTNPINWITIDHISVSHASNGIAVNGNNWVVSNFSGAVCSTNLTISGTPVTLSSVNSVQGTNSYSFNTETLFTGTININACQTTTTIGVASKITNHTTGGTLNVRGCNQGTALSIGGACKLATVNITDNTGTGVTLANTAGKVYMSALSCARNTIGLNVTGLYAKILSLTTTSNTSKGVNISTPASHGVCILHNWVSTSDATRLSSTFTTYSDFRLMSHEQDGTTTNHVITTDGGTIQSTTATRHTASGIAWQLSPTSITRNSNYPLSLSAAKMYVTSGVAATITAYAQRSSATNLSYQLRIPGNSIGGVGTSDIVATATASANTWEQLSVSFTPTESGVIEIFFDTWITGAGVTDSAYIDDMAFTG